MERCIEDARYEKMKNNKKRMRLDSMYDILLQMVINKYIQKQAITIEIPEYMMFEAEERSIKFKIIGKKKWS